MKCFKSCFLALSVDPVEATTFLSPQTIRRQSFGAIVGGNVAGDEYDIFNTFASLKRGDFHYPVITNVQVRRESNSHSFPSTSGRKSPPPPPPQRRHNAVGNGVAAVHQIGRNDLEELKEFFATQLTSMKDNPVKIVNPLYESQFPTVRTLNRVSAADADYSTLQRDTNNDGTVKRRQKQIFADQLTQLKNAGAMNNRLRNVDYPKPYRSFLLNNSTGSDNGSNSDRSSSLSDSTLNSSNSNRIVNGARTTNGVGAIKDDFMKSSTDALIKSSSSPAVRHSPVLGRVANYTPDPIRNGKSTETDTMRKQTKTPFSTTPTIKPSINGEQDSLSISSVDSKDSDYQELLLCAELPPMNSIVASGRLVSLRQNLQIAVRQLCSFTTRNWRRKEFLDSHLLDIRSKCHQTLAYLKSFVDFAVGSFVNLSRRRIKNDGADGNASAKKLAHLIRPLRRSLNLLLKLRQLLDDDGWFVDKFVRDINGGNDNLDQFIAIAKQTPEDARQVATFIHANSVSIFTIDSSASLDTIRDTTNGSMSDQKVIEEHELEMDDDMSSSDDEKGSLFDDYDFVDGKQAPSTNGFVENNKNGQKLFSSSSSFDSTSTALVDMCVEDKQIMKFYTPQVNNHIEFLNKAIDEFLASVEKNEPPKIFVANSRFVVLASHKLIYIGDNLSQCMKTREIGEKIKEKSDKLCDVLKFCVAATKHAALQFPAVASVQMMLDSMVNVSQSAHELTLLINQIAKLYV